LTVRDITIGSGIPKVVVPIVGKTQEEIINDAKLIVVSDPGLIEWRADFYVRLFEEQKVKETLKILRHIIGNTPLIFTIRTDAEGGNIQISDRKYGDLLRFVADTREADLIDIELFRKGIKIDELVRDIHSLDVLVIMSSHDFQGTPEKNEIIDRFRKMQDLGADLPKIAAMPKTPADVITLLCATNEMARDYALTPLVSMSMGGLGSISRLAGEIFGSSLTFGNAGKSSAPGQIPLSELKQSLQTIHASLDQFKI